MKSVLFYATRNATAGRPLSTQTPASLINRDVIGPLVPGLRQLKRSRNGSTAAADDSDLYRLSNSQLPLPHLGRAAQSRSARSQAFSTVLM